MRTAAVLSAALLAALALSAPAAAKEKCLEGRTRSGECVDVQAAEAGVKDAILATQAKISMSAPLTLPGDPDEGKYRWNYAEGRAFFRSAPIAAGGFAGPPPAPPAVPW